VGALYNQTTKAIQTVLEVINRVSSEFKKIPSIDRTLAIRYEQQLEDIQKWLTLTSWSQEQISVNEIAYVQKRLIKLDMIKNELDTASYTAF